MAWGFLEKEWQETLKDALSFGICWSGLDGRTELDFIQGSGSNLYIGCPQSLETDDSIYYLPMEEFLII